MDSTAHQLLEQVQARPRSACVMWKSSAHAKMSSSDGDHARNNLPSGSIYPSLAHIMNISRISDHAPKR